MREFVNRVVGEAMLVAGLVLLLAGVVAVVLGSRIDATAVVVGLVALLLVGFGLTIRVRGRPW